MLVFKRFNFWLWFTLLAVFCCTMTLLVLVKDKPSRVKAATEVVLQPGATGKDAFVADWYSSEDCSDTNFGNETFMIIGAAAPTWHSYLQFDLSSIPSGVVIESAELSVNVSNVNGVSNTITIHKITSAWGEDTITYNNQPSSSASYGTATVSMIGWTAFDVTEIIADSIDLNDYGIALKYYSHSGEYPFTFYSSEEANSVYHPKLTITYSGGAPASTCSDGIQNGDETGVDCGGSCNACPTCSDGIQNQDETGVDCGGSCVACLESETHKTCVNNACQIVLGAGVDTCSDNSQCLGVSSPTHKVCRSNKCEVASGEGTDECIDDTSCVANTSTPIRDDNPNNTGDTTGDVAPTADPDNAGKNSSNNTQRSKTISIKEKIETAIKGMAEIASDKNIPLIPLAVAGILSIISVSSTLWTLMSAEVTIKEYLLTIINYFATLFSAKRKDKRGLVYDASTSKPLSGALITIYAFPEMKLIMSAISDFKGRFNFIVGKGKYVMSVTKMGYLFPSMIAKKGISYSRNVYIGQTLEYDDAEVINSKIAMDPIANAKRTSRSMLAVILMSNVIRLTIMIIGTIVAATMIIYQPNVKNYLVLIAYIILWAVELIIENREVNFSHVLEKDKKSPVDLALVRVMSENGKLKQTYVTDYKGRVAIKSDKSTDIISIDRVGYKKMEFGSNKEGFIEGKTFFLEKI